MAKIKRMSINEFQKKGFLQEANRLFFHPLGMALEVSADWPKGITAEEKKKYKNAFEHPKSVYKLSGVWDYRDDSEGMLFGDNVIDKKKAEKIRKLRDSKLPKRVKLDQCDDNGIQQF